MKKILILFFTIMFISMLVGCRADETTKMNNVELISATSKQAHHIASRGDSRDYDYEEYFFTFKDNGVKLTFNVSKDIYNTYNQNKRFNVEYTMEDDIPQLKHIEALPDSEDNLLKASVK